MGRQEFLCSFNQYVCNGDRVYHVALVNAGKNSTVGEYQFDYLSDRGEPKRKHFKGQVYEL